MDFKEWEQAMKDELISIEINKVWELVNLPKERKPTGCKRVLKKQLKAGRLG